MRGFSLLSVAWAGPPPELHELDMLRKKSLHILRNLPLIIFPKTIDTPNKNQFFDFLKNFLYNIYRK